MVTYRVLKESEYSLEIESNLLVTVPSISIPQTRNNSQIVGLVAVTAVNGITGKRIDISHEPGNSHCCRHFQRFFERWNSRALQKTPESANGSVIS